MTSRVKVRRRTAFTTQDESTGLEVPVWDVTYPSLPFRLGGAQTSLVSTHSHTVSLGGVDIQFAARLGHMPAGTDNLADDDLIEVISGENTGGVYRIVESAWQDQATARRVPVIEEVRPAEWDA